MFLLPLLILLSALCGVLNAAPIRVCSPVLPADPAPGRCEAIPASKQGELERELKSNLQEIAEISRWIEGNSSCHPHYLSLNITQRGTNTGINPSVDNTDYSDLGHAVNTWKQCFFPATHNLTGSESELQMDGQLFHFAVEFRTLEGKIATLVPKLNTLARSDNRLSSGTGCIVPTASCMVPNWTMAGHVTSSQERLRRLVNIAVSTRHYASDLAGSRYFVRQGY